MDLRDIEGTFQKNTNGYTFFSHTERSSKLSPIWTQAHLKRYKTIEVISYILSDHHEFKTGF